MVTMLNPSVTPTLFCYFCSVLIDLGTGEFYPVLSNNNFFEGHFTF